MGTHRHWVYRPQHKKAASIEDKDDFLTIEDRHDFFLCIKDDNKGSSLNSENNFYIKCQIAFAYQCYKEFDISNRNNFTMQSQKSYCYLHVLVCTQA